MATIIVRNEKELTEALKKAGLTPTPLPELPVTVGGVTYDWDETVYQSRMSADELDHLYGDLRFPKRK